jgi:hypothetical protein
MVRLHLSPRFTIATLMEKGESAWTFSKTNGHHLSQFRRLYYQLYPYSRIQILVSFTVLANLPIDDPLVPNIARMLRSNKEKHDKKAQECTKKYATN